ncbi:MAG: hypothetical protein IPP06_06190 [Saprospiraceae bacterium]|nr:hypothetical protein [Candidatus Vicinibacter affinis]
MRSEIEKYINGDLKGEKLLAFEEAMQKDSELKREVEIQKRMVNDLEAIRISNKIKKIQKQQVRLHHIKWTLFILSLMLIATILLINKYRRDRNSELNPIEQIKVDSISDPINFNSDSIRLKSNHIYPDSLKTPREFLEEETKPTIDKKKSEIKKKQEFAGKPIDDKNEAVESLFILSSDQDMKEIALREYTVPDELAFLRSTGPVSALDSVKYLFNEAQYEPGLKALARSGLSTADRKFIAANFLFKQGQFKQSIELLNHIPARDVTELRRDQIEWQMFLCHLAIGQSQFRQLNLIYAKVKKQPGHLYKKRIEKIRSEIFTLAN